MDYSITIKPWEDTWNKIDKKKLIFFNLFTKNVEKYIISYEKGNKDYYNHYQCYFKYPKPKRQDKIKESILKTLCKLEIELHPEERQHGIKVKEIKTNLETVRGYPLKEGGTFISKGFTEEELEIMKNNYLKHKENNDLDKKSFFRTNPKNFHIYIRNFINENPEHLKDKYTTEDIKDILGEMTNRGYYLGFINSRNIIEKILYVKCFLNKNGIDYYNYCYNKCERLEPL